MKKKQDALNPFVLENTVGPKGANNQLDVAKVETLVGTLDDFDLKRTDGPTGYYGERLKQGVKKYQKKKKLKIDGIVKPNGETLRELELEAKKKSDKLSFEFKGNEEPESDNIFLDIFRGISGFILKHKEPEPWPQGPYPGGIRGDNSKGGGKKPGST